MDTLREIFQKINIHGQILFQEPMKYHTSFKIGGAADVYVIPKTEADIVTVLEQIKETNIPVFPLGGGANILVSEKGIRGIVLDMSSFNRYFQHEGAPVFTAESGVRMSDFASFTAGLGFTGLEVFYSMPGSVGGSVYMNARCYGRSIADSIDWVEVVSPGMQDSTRVSMDSKDFAYKTSPFQGKGDIIIRSTFTLIPGNKEELLSKMTEMKRDRIKKGHFLYPSAGSIFKNNRDFGKPSGEIIDEIGLKGIHLGGAMISEKHANIIVNTGNAKAEDIRKLIELIEYRVYSEVGIRLDREILLVGEW